MGDFPHYFDIILFAMVAAFLVLRLRSVLGRRTGQERRRNNPFLRQAEPPRDQGAADKVVPLGDRWPSLSAFLARLTRRPSVARVLEEAAPYFAMFPA